LIVVGPHKLPEIAKSLGKGLAEFKKVSDGFKHSVQEVVKNTEDSTKDQKVASVTVELVSTQAMAESIIKATP
jgi:sec-independent protein translocase protein TatA